MLQIPLWNRVLIVGVVASAVWFAAPNLFYERVERHNDAVAEIDATGVTTDTLAADRAGWPGFLPTTLVNLGLDLRGGAHLLAEVRVEDVHEARMDALMCAMRCAICGRTLAPSDAKMPPLMNCACVSANPRAWPPL